MGKSYLRLSLIAPFSVSRPFLARKDMTPIQIGNLVFYHKPYYEIYKKLDRYMKILIKCAERGEIDVDEYFYYLPDLKVYPIVRDSWLEVYDLFPSMRKLISPEEKTDCTKDKIGLRFFSKIIFKDDRNRRLKTGLEFVDPSNSFNPHDKYYYEPRYINGSGWRTIVIQKNKN